MLTCRPGFAQPRLKPACSLASILIAAERRACPCVVFSLPRDGSGTIDISELADALKQFGIYGSDEQELLKSADTNGDGQVCCCAP